MYLGLRAQIGFNRARSAPQQGKVHGASSGTACIASNCRRGGDGCDTQSVPTRACRLELGRLELAVCPDAHGVCQQRRLRRRHRGAGCWPDGVVEVSLPVSPIFPPPPAYASCDRSFGHLASPCCALRERCLISFLPSVACGRGCWSVFV